MKRNNHPLLPQIRIRGLIVGKAGQGKTNLLLNLLLNSGWLDYNNLIVFGKSLHQPEYLILNEGFKQGLTKCEIQNFIEKQKYIKSSGISPTLLLQHIGENRQPSIHTVFYEDAKNVPDPQTLDETLKNVIVFDDILLEKQNKCEAFYTRGRHNNIDCFYIAQNYFKLPRQTIRENSNFIILFQQDKRNIQNIYQDHASHDMSRDEFNNFCKLSWQEPYSFITIDKTSKKNDGKYRCCFDKFYISIA